ncbi:MAG: hypothetical protein ACKPHU_27840, partial [Planctomycetaceae bacterium]
IVRPLASGMVSSSVGVRSGHAADRSSVSGEIVASNWRMVGSCRSSGGLSGKIVKTSGMLRRSAG